jgi:alkanesulfonate monooxygenase SsuD/methylene tetrahydromethanopterin reductase-like flavin-dependent oxidoreductase (luciferase family)
MKTKMLENCGLMLEPQEGFSASDVLDLAEYAESLGFGYLLRSDHLLPTSGRRGIDSPECWTTLASISVKTKNIRFGPLVSPIGFRNPALLAKMASTLNSLSGGRLVLGVGAGWYGEEYSAFGYEFPKFSVRVEQLSEGLSIITKLLKEGHCTFRGKYFSVDLELYTRQRTHIIVGGRAKSIVKLSSFYADEWNIFSPTKQRFDLLKGYVSKKVLISQMSPFLLAENKEELRNKADSLAKEMGYSVSADTYIQNMKNRGAIVGTCRDFKDEIRKRIEWGIEKFYFQIVKPKDRKTIELLASTLREV